MKVEVLREHQIKWDNATDGVISIKDSPDNHDWVIISQSKQKIVLPKEVLYDLREALDHFHK